MGWLNKYNFVEEFNRSRKGMASNIKPIKPVYDSNYSEFDHNLAAAKDPVVRNNADFSKTTEVSITRSRENGEVCPDDMIIDSIVKTDDLTLLSNTYKSNMNIACDLNLGHIDENLFKKYATVSPEDFINFVTSTDTSVLVQNKSEWLQHSENFSTLLDDVLRSFGHDMDLDCY